MNDKSFKDVFIYIIIFELVLAIFLGYTLLINSNLVICTKMYKGRGIMSPGEYGDIFGPLATLFSAFAFTGAAIAISLQSKQLKSQREEYDLSRVTQIHQYEISKIYALKNDNKASIEKFTPIFKNPRSEAISESTLNWFSKIKKRHCNEDSHLLKEFKSYCVNIDLAKDYFYYPVQQIAGSVWLLDNLSQNSKIDKLELEYLKLRISSALGSEITAPIIEFDEKFGLIISAIVAEMKNENLDLTDKIQKKDMEIPSFAICFNMVLISQYIQNKEMIDYQG